MKSRLQTPSRPPETVCKVFAGMVSEVFPALAPAPSPFHLAQEGMKTPGAGAGLKKTGFPPSAASPQLPLSEGKVRRRRREGNNCSQTIPSETNPYLLTAKTKQNKAANTPAEKEKCIQTHRAKRALPGHLPALGLQAQS